MQMQPREKSIEHRQIILLNASTPQHLNISTPHHLNLSTPKRLYE